MYQAIGIVELKSIAKGIEATDAALKSAGVKLVSAHPSCPGKYEIILTGGIADVEAFSAASLIRAADIAVKTAKVAIYELRLSRGMGGKGLVIITGDVGDVTASVEAGAAYAKEQGLFCNSAVIPAPHKELWEQLS